MPGRDTKTTPPAQPAAPDSATRRQLCAGAACAVVGGCAVPRAVPPDLDLSVLRSLLARAVADGRIPGAAVWLERRGTARQVVVGHRATWPDAEVLDVDTVYDVASLTKPFTALLVMQLVEAGTLALDAPLGAALPAWAGHPSATLRHLLTHSSGLPAGLSLLTPWHGAAQAVEQACRAPATHPPGEVFRYSDVNFILLGAVAEQASGEPLQSLLRRRVLEPLAMAGSGYLPLTWSAAQRIAPTEVVDGAALRGQVHDPTARRMGGVAGHAGMYSTLADLARFARWWLGGDAAAPALLQPATKALMTRPAQPPAAVELPRRGLGWDIDSPYSRARGRLYARGRSYGHTGFTGCSIWIDPQAQGFSVLLSNRVHPHAGQSIVSIYDAVATAAAAALGITAD